MPKFNVQIKEQIATIAHDLMNLEVNTIIKGNITGRKMPSPRHALIDIAKSYVEKLTALGYPLEDTELNPGSFQSFHVIREKAKEAIKVLEDKARTDGLSGKEGPNLIMLWRIKTMSDQIKGIYNALARRTDPSCKDDFDREKIENDLPPLSLNSQELVKIRKIWEMKVQEIALQTVIQIDGDIINCVKWGFQEAEHSGLHHLHNQGVNACLNFWKELIAIVKDSLESLLKLVF
jgi:hypothetical protein